MPGLSEAFISRIMLMTKIEDEMVQRISLPTAFFLFTPPSSHPRTWRHKTCNWTHNPYSLNSPLNPLLYWFNSLPRVCQLGWNSSESSSFLCVSNLLFTYIYHSCHSQHISILQFQPNTFIKLKFKTQIKMQISLRKKAIQVSVCPRKI